MLVGASEFAEIASLTAHDHAVTLVCVLDAALARASFCGIPVVHNIADLPQFDAAILTQTGDIAGLVEQLQTALGEGHVYTPRLVELNHINAAAKRSRASRPAAVKPTDARGD